VAARHLPDSVRPGVCILIRAIEAARTPGKTRRRPLARGLIARDPRPIIGILCGQFPAGRGAGHEPGPDRKKRCRADHPRRPAMTYDPDLDAVQSAKSGVAPNTMDPYEIGWYIESADEEIYGPVSRRALHHFLQDKTITPNTLVRHCTQAEAKPV